MDLEPPSEVWGGSQEEERHRYAHGGEAAVGAASEVHAEPGQQRRQTQGHLRAHIAKDSTHALLQSAQRCEQQHNSTDPLLRGSMQASSARVTSVGFNRVFTFRLTVKATCMWETTMQDPKTNANCQMSVCTILSRENTANYRTLPAVRLLQAQSRWSSRLGTSDDWLMKVQCKFL